MRRSLSLLLLSLVAVFSISACSGVTHKLDYQAGTADVCGLYVSASDADAFGENELKNDAILAAKAQMDIVVPAAGNYDLKRVACDGREAVLTVAVP